MERSGQAWLFTKVSRMSLKQNDHLLFTQEFSLETLYLNDNQLTKIEKPSTNEMFAELRYLRIENNAIGDWDSLNALNCFGNLTKLRCKQNPIFIGTS